MGAGCKSGCLYDFLIISFSTGLSWKDRIDLRVLNSSNTSSQHGRLLRSIGFTLLSGKSECKMAFLGHIATHWPQEMHKLGSVVSGTLFGDAERKSPSGKSERKGRI